jgi:hypothetical protein
VYEPNQTARVLEDVAAERERQANRLGWTQQHDDGHSIHDFVGIAGHQIRKAHAAEDSTTEREHVVQAIAVLVAFAEALDRKASA